MKTYSDDLTGVFALLVDTADKSTLRAVDALVERNWTWQADPENPGVWGLMHPKEKNRAAMVVYVEDGDFECDMDVLAGLSGIKPMCDACGVAAGVVVTPASETQKQTVYCSYCSASRTDAHNPGSYLLTVSSVTA